MMAARLPSGMYDCMKKSKIAIAGAGGLGSNIASALARCFVGELFITDFDKVEPSNLNRQHYRMCDIGKYKTDALKEQLNDINPFVKVTTANLRITADNAPELFNGYDIICEAFDQAEEKAMLVTALLKNTKNSIIICGSGMAGIGRSNEIRTKKINNRLYICGDMFSDMQQGMTAPRVIMCAMHQANLAVELLVEKYGGK